MSESFTVPDSHVTYLHLYVSKRMNCTSYKINRRQLHADDDTAIEGQFAAQSSNTLAVLYSWPGIEAVGRPH